MKNLVWYNLVIIGVFSVLTLSNCESQNESPKASRQEIPPFELSQGFKDYWYKGMAELTTFELEQVRYGEVREGQATTVFVTEDFSKSRFVKLDYPEKARADKVNVLKFNLNKKFVTGIYDYALMQSVFKPVDLNNYPKTLRVTTANIEWCGQFLTSARLNEKGYKVDYNSYFDGEEAAEIQLSYALLEDEIWSLIRIAPDRLPTGKIAMIPGILTQELTHHELKVEKAECELLKNDSLSIYTIDYPALPRKLVITFENEFPYRIVAWEETFKTVSGWGMEPKVMTTKAKRIKYTLSDYWEKKYLKDEVMRKRDLGIED